MQILYGFLTLALIYETIGIIAMGFIALGLFFGACALFCLYMFLKYSK